MNHQGSCEKTPAALKAKWPKGDEMNWMLRALGPAVGLFVAMSPGHALAQVDSAVPDLTEMTAGEMTWPETTWPEMTWPAGAVATTLQPAEILADVRREGFYPVSRPVQRGRVYILFAVDQDDFDVQLTVDAVSGRVLRVAGAVAGSPGHHGYQSIWREPSPLPPADTPPAQNSSGPAGTRHASPKRFPPLLRNRPVFLAGAPETAPSPAPAATMVPVAPLE